MRLSAFWCGLVVVTGGQDKNPVGEHSRLNMLLLIVPSSVGSSVSIDGVVYGKYSDVTPDDLTPGTLFIFETLLVFHERISIKYHSAPAAVARIPMRKEGVNAPPKI